MTVPASEWKNQQLISQVQILEDKINALIEAFNNHTHRSDGAQTGEYNVSKPQSDEETIAPVNASVINDLDLSDI